VRSFRFLLSRRWALFTIAVAILAYGTWWLGEWQWGRLQDKHHGNATISANLKQTPEPVAEVLAPGKPVSDGSEWKRVTATGTYDVAHTITWRYRTNDHSESGIDVVVPLITADGTGLLVDRGWIASRDQDNDPVAIPKPPPGEVTVVGWVRADATGDSTRVSALGTRAVSSVAIAPAIGRTLYGGFVNLQSETPEPTTPLTPNDEPDLSNGPHFFYALQWWFFGVLAIGGFLYLLYDERRLHLRHPDQAPADGAPATPPGGETAPMPARREAAEPAVTRAAAGPATALEERRDDRRSRREQKNARKQALAAAYAEARARDEANRTKAFGQSVERTGRSSRSD
jgi:cytochrome oxidase assembly protein ShyY1